jgi:putative FmdB family regulatory protein
VPTYQYVCTDCGTQLEAVQKFTDEPLTVHDDCGGRLRKVFSPVGIVFKGSGFYRTDSRSSSSSTSSSSSSTSSSSSGSAESSSTSGGEKQGGDKADKSDKTEKKAATATGSSSSAGSSSGEKVA